MKLKNKQKTQQLVPYYMYKNRHLIHKVQTINAKVNRDVVKFCGVFIYSEQPHHQKEHVEK